MRVGKLSSSSFYVCRLVMSTSTAGQTLARGVTMQALVSLHRNHSGLIVHCINSLVFMLLLSTRSWPLSGRAAAFTLPRRGSCLARIDSTSWTWLITTSPVCLLDFSTTFLLYLIFYPNLSYVIKRFHSPRLLLIIFQSLWAYFSQSEYLSVWFSVL
jgi:hypothetical protein